MKDEVYRVSFSLQRERRGVYLQIRDRHIAVGRCTGHLHAHLYTATLLPYRWSDQRLSRRQILTDTDCSRPWVTSRLLIVFTTT